MADISEEDALCLVQLQTIVVLHHFDDNESRRDYMRPVFARRKQQGDYYQLVRELEIADAEYFGRYARFSPALLEEVLQLVGPHIERCRTHRIPIGPKERLMMTIR